jgi:hypothetical protein
MHIKAFVTCMEGGYECVSCSAIVLGREVLVSAGSSLGAEIWDGGLVDRASML